MRGLFSFALLTKEAGMCKLVLIITIAASTGIVLQLVVAIEPGKERPKPDPKGFNAQYGYE